ncbi:MAG: glycoside hydrolase family 32 protein, partial [Sphaerospermopsis sp. SIO1G2]|nr:glycoside hydrolase family 32 protein [Sphaerospermopsis sp. SIO1G2]
STNLLDWEHYPIALAPYEKGWVFSGSAVVDWHNTAGFGANALIAIFTLHDWTNPERTDQFQNQGIAYSLDNGRTWTQYESNPVIEMPSDMGHQEFRDPKVFWYGTPDNGHWVMILAVNDQTWLYTSPDLKNWAKASEFGRDYGAHGSVWECPDLFQIPIAGGNETRWILLVSVQDGSPAGWNGVQYFVGDFDGHQFTPHEAPEVTRWCDWGPDFYAAVTWENEPNGRRLLIGWMNNWPYSRTIPATEWRGMLSLPRELTLAHKEDHLQLLSQPIQELAARSQPSTVRESVVVTSDQPCSIISEIGNHAIMLNIEFDLTGTDTAEQFGVVLTNGETRYGSVVYHTRTHRCELTRTEAGESVPEMVQGTPFVTTIRSQNGRLRWQIILDHHSLELFLNDGEQVMSQLIFPNDLNLGIQLFAQGGTVNITRLEHAFIA